MIYISKAAQIYFAKLLSYQDQETQIRVFVINQGTHRAESGISYCPQNSIESTDIAIKFSKFTVYVDKNSAPYLKDAEIDFIENKFNSQLTIKAPNIKIGIPGSEASLVDRVKYFLESQINPQLANHGGHVNLIEITKEYNVILYFTGSCNGCAMINITLKNGIEKQLLNEFPELKGVIDLTDHKYGEHSYY